MKISLRKKILIGFIINLVVIGTLIWIFVIRFNSQIDVSLDKTMNWIGFSLEIISIFLFLTIYYLMRLEQKGRNVSQSILFDKTQLLQSLVDNTSNPIFIKKLNGEYILINKQCESLFQVTADEILNKTDYEFLPKATADLYRNSDFEVVKALRELKTEETVHEPDGELHTYIAVKFPLYDSQRRIYAIGGISTDITERKKTEDALRGIEKLFNMSSDIMGIASKDKFIKVNPAFINLFGYSEEELLSQPFLSFVHSEDYEITRKEVKKLQTGVSTINFENRWVCKEGSYKWLEWSVTNDLSTGLLYAIARDVTNQKENDLPLIAAEKFFNMSYDILVIAKEDYFVKVNPAFKRNFGYDQKEMETKTFASFIHPDDVRASINILRNLQKGGFIVNYRARARSKDGEYKCLDWSITMDLHTSIMYAVGRDVTELVENEQSLAIADKFFNMAFDILTVSKEERFIKINPAFTEILGYNLDDLDNLKFTELIHPEDKGETNKVFAKLLKGTPIVNFKDRILCKDGSYKWLDWHSNFDLKQGTLYSVARDITEQIKLEKEQHLVTSELYENEEKLRLILENLNEGVIVANSEKKIILANEMANEILGIKEDERISENSINQFEIFYPDEKTVFPSQNLPMERAFKGESTYDVDLVLVDSKTNEKKRILLSGKPLIDENKKVVAVVLTIKDISKYKQLEQTLKDTETKYRQLIGFRKGGDLAI